MQWWAWVALGAVLLGAELTFIDAQFYLVFVGGSALVVGFLGLAGPSEPWLQWAVFGLVAVLSVVVFRRRVYALLRRKLPEMQHGPVGQRVLLPTALQPGESCRLEYSGSSWNAINGGKSAILAGERALVDRVDGLTLVLHGEAS